MQEKNGSSLLALQEVACIAHPRTDQPTTAEQLNIFQWLAVTAYGN